MLSSLCNHLNKKVCRDFKIFADLTNYKNPGNLFKSERPDIVIKENDSITPIELKLSLKKYKRNENFATKIKYR